MGNAKVRAGIITGVCLLGVCLGLVAVGFFVSKSRPMGAKTEEKTQGAFKKEDLSQEAPRGPENDQAQSKEIIWAGLSGNPPKYFDSGENKGLGYLEVQTKTIRKALQNAGFKLKYEYFSSARLAYEFQSRSPICFYPFDWQDPKSRFKNPPDRVLSVPLSFGGEERHSVIVRAKDASRFKPHLKSNGTLELRSLLKDPNLKTIFPTDLVLGKEFEGVFKTGENGIAEVTPDYRKQIETRVFRDYNQLIQMLQGERVDYLLGNLVTEDDYKMIRAGRSSFQSLTYRSEVIQKLTDSSVILSSVACGLHPTSIEAMPIINQAIRNNRANMWMLHNARYRQKLEPSYEVPLLHSTVQYRFESDLTSGSVDSWYDLQMKAIPGLRLLPQKPRLEKPEKFFTSSGAGNSKPKKKARWMALQPTQTALWLLKESDYQDLIHPYARKTDAYDQWLSRWGNHFGFAIGFDALEGLRSLKDSNFMFFDGFIEALESKRSGQSSLESLSVSALGLNESELMGLAPILKNGQLKRLALVGAAHHGLDQILPLLPVQLESLNLASSALLSQELHPQVKRLPRLRELNIRALSLLPADYRKTLLALPPELERLYAGWNELGWTPEFAAEFAQKRLPRLEVLDFEHNALDDRHCSALKVFGSNLTQLGLNFNSFTSECLKEVLSKPLARLDQLELAFSVFSKKAGFVLKIPESVTHLDLSFAGLDAESLSHLKMPNHLKTLLVRENRLNYPGVLSLLDHLASRVARLDFSKNPALKGPLFQDLEKKGVVEIGELDLSGVALEWSPLPKESSLNVTALRAANCGLSDFGLGELWRRWGKRLREIDVSENLISTQGLLQLLQDAPGLRSLVARSLLDVDLRALAPKLPKGLIHLDLALNDLNDEDVLALTQNLPQGLKRLDLSGSLFGRVGAMSLAHHMPALVQLSLVLPLDEIALTALFEALPSQLKRFQFGPSELSLQATQSFLRNLPPCLEQLLFQSVQLNLESLPELAAGLPQTLREVLFWSSTSIRVRERPRGVFLWPQSLRELAVYTHDVSDEILKTWFRVLPPSIKAVALRTNAPSEETLTRLIQALRGRASLFEFSFANLTQQSLLELELNEPRFIALIGTAFKGMTHDHFTATLLKEVKVFMLLSPSGGGRQLHRLVGRLPASLRKLDWRSTSLVYEDLDFFLRALPSGISQLNFGGNKIGSKGVERLMRYQSEREAKTGFPLELIAE